MIRAVCGYTTFFEQTQVHTWENTAKSCKSVTMATNGMQDTISVSISHSCNGKFVLYCKIVE